MTRTRTIVAAALVAAVVGAVVWALSGTHYHVKLALQNADNLFNGARVQVNGFDVGSVNDIKAGYNNAIVDMAFDSRAANIIPLHQGAKVRVRWKALLGERELEVVDGPASNPTIPIAFAGLWCLNTIFTQLMLGLNPQMEVFR